MSETIRIFIADDHPVFRFVNMERLYISRFNLWQPADDVRAVGS